MDEESSRGLLERLRYHERGYTEVEAAIARELIGDPQRAIAEPIELFARRVGVSAGSVVRFARLMGFSGYRSLKFALAAERFVAEQESGVERSPMQSLLEPHAMAISFAARTLDAGTFDLAAEVLSAAHRIDIVGVGAASATARAAEFQLSICGFHCRRVDDSGEAAAEAGFLGCNGVLLAISHSGRTRATVDAARRARTSGAAVIAICSVARSPLAEASTHLLGVEAAETRYGLEEAPFRAAHLAIAQALTRAAFESLPPDERAARRSTWASARFELRYGHSSDVRSSADSETFTD